MPVPVGLLHFFNVPVPFVVMVTDEHVVFTTAADAGIANAENASEPVMTNAATLLRRTRTRRCMGIPPGSGP